MESFINDLNAETFRDRVETCRLNAEDLARKFIAAEVLDRKSALAYEWEKAIQAKHAAQLMADLLERQEHGSATRF